MNAPASMAVGQRHVRAIRDGLKALRDRINQEIEEAGEEEG
jgi:hypothetical protein